MHNFNNNSTQNNYPKGCLSITRGVKEGSREVFFQPHRDANPSQVIRALRKGIRIGMSEIKGYQAKIYIQADRSINIVRTELLKHTPEQNGTCLVITRGVNESNREIILKADDQMSDTEVFKAFSEGLIVGINEIRGRQVKLYVRAEKAINVMRTERATEFAGYESENKYSGLRVA